jgi:hypothetical protein
MELEKVLVIDPVTNVEETYKTKEVVYKSNVNTSLYRYVADSQSTTNVIFNNITPPSLNTIINRCLKLKYQLAVSVTGVVGGAQPTIQANAICGPVGPFVGAGLASGVSVLGNNASAGIILADSPLQTSCTAIELRINGSSTSISPNDYIQLYGHMASKDDLNMFSTTYPHQKDNMSVYYPSGDDEFNFRSPFQQFNVNTDVQSRASSVWTLVSQVAGVDLYTVDVMEDLYLSPMVWGELGNKCAGLSNINNLTLNLRIANLNRAVRVITLAFGTTNTTNFGGNISAISVDFGTGIGRNAELELQYITPDPVLAAKMPSVLAYDYDYIQSFITSGSLGLLTNAGTEVIFQSVRLPSIPKRIYIYAKPSKNLFVQGSPALNTVPDFFLPISNVKITFNNRINLLANDIAQTLYNKSVANGLKDSFYEWQYGCGSIMIIDVAKDLGLEADECVGQANKYSTLQVQATFSNTNLTFQGAKGTLPVPNPTNLANMNLLNSYDYYILVESTGKAFITPSDCQFVLTGPSSAEVLALTSNMDKVVDQSDLDGKQVGGGAFGIGKLFKSGLNLIKNVDPEKVVDGLKGVQQTLGAMGLGVAGGAMKHRRVR